MVLSVVGGREGKSWEGGGVLRFVGFEEKAPGPSLTLPIQVVGRFRTAITHPV